MNSLICGIGFAFSPYLLVSVILVFGMIYNYLKWSLLVFGAGFLGSAVIGGYHLYHGSVTAVTASSADADTSRNSRRPGSGSGSGQQIMQQSEIDARVQAYSALVSSGLAQNLPASVNIGQQQQQQRPRQQALQVQAGQRPVPLRGIREAQTSSTESLSTSSSDTSTTSLGRVSSTFTFT